MIEEAKSNSIITERVKKSEDLEQIRTSDVWNESLMKKIDTMKPYSNSFSSTPKFTLLFLFIVLINIGFIFIAINTKTQNTPIQDNGLQVISKEFLINPISLNN